MDHHNEWYHSMPRFTVLDLYGRPHFAEVLRKVTIITAFPSRLTKNRRLWINKSSNLEVFKAWCYPGWNLGGTSYCSDINDNLHWFFVSNECEVHHLDSKPGIIECVTTVTSSGHWWSWWSDMASFVWRIKHLSVIPIHILCCICSWRIPWSHKQQS